MKQVVFRAFKIMNANKTIKAQKLREELSNRLKVAKDVEKRLMPLHEKNPDSDKDGLADFADAQEGKYVYGVIMRFTQAKNVPAAPKDFENKTNLKESDLDVPPELKGKWLCRYVYHVLITDKLVVTDLKKDYTVVRLEKYLNYLLMGRDYDLIPVVGSNELKMRDIKSIVFKNPSVDRKDLKVDLSITDKAKELLKQLFPRVENLDDIMAKNIVTAKMTLNIAKPKEMSDEDYENQLGAVLKPLGDPTLVSLGVANGREIKGEDVLYSKEIELPETPEDKDYIEAMKLVVKELKD